MKERPILFSGPMVRAILDGTKTQTRRVLVKQPLDIIPMKGKLTGIEWVGLTKRPPDPKGLVFRCRLGVPGDRLWVRETWAMQAEYCLAYRADGQCGAMVQDGAGAWAFLHHGWVVGFSEKADGRFYDLNRYGGQWRPSIYMPRWASRITLEIVEVRAQRLQRISHADAKAEGVYREFMKKATRETIPPMTGPRDSPLSPKVAYQWLWDSLNAKRGFGWDTNPYVWAIEFKRVT